jgi:hypothetical protein
VPYSLPGKHSVSVDSWGEMRAPGTHGTILLVGCVSRKASTPMPAMDLYTSELFRRRRLYAERSGLSWFILSALHGLVDPHTVIEPYDVTLKRMARQERASWGQKVVSQMTDRFKSLSGVTLEVHAGDEYVAGIEPSLRRLGAEVRRPLRGLRIGEQLQWYGGSWLASREGR